MKHFHGHIIQISLYLLIVLLTHNSFEPDTGNKFDSVTCSCKQAWNQIEYIYTAEQSINSPVYHLSRFLVANLNTTPRWSNYVANSVKCEWRRWQQEIPQNVILRKPALFLKFRRYQEYSNWAKISKRGIVWALSLGISIFNSPSRQPQWGVFTNRNISGNIGRNVCMSSSSLNWDSLWDIPQSFILCSEPSFILNA